MKKEDTVTLISVEGYEFVIDKEAVMVSQTISNMLTSPGSFTETELGQVTFPELSKIILEKIYQYLYWSLQYAKFYADIAAFFVDIILLITLMGYKLLLLSHLKTVSQIEHIVNGFVRTKFFSYGWSLLCMKHFSPKLLVLLLPLRRSKNWLFFIRLVREFKFTN